MTRETFGAILLVLANIIPGATFYLVRYLYPCAHRRPSLAIAALPGRYFYLPRHHIIGAGYGQVLSAR